MASAIRASSKIITGDFPPNSITTGFICSAHVLAMILPVGALPVNETRRTFGWPTRASPLSGPMPANAFEHASRKSSLYSQLRQDQTSRWSFFGHSQDHRVACGQGRGALLNGGLDRRVPRWHGGNHAQGLVHHHIHVVVIKGQHIAIVGHDETGVVANHIGDVGLPCRRRHLLTPPFLRKLQPRSCRDWHQ